MATQTRQTRVLRIGIIQDRNIVQERLIKAGETVTVGEATTNTFIFPPSSLPPSFTLFRWTGEHYELDVAEGMTGKVVSSGSEIRLENLKAQTPGGPQGLKLSEQDKGKISVGDVTVLFQFVVPPPPATVAPMQAMDFRPRIFEDDDPTFLLFLALWSALGAVFVVWVTTSERPEMIKIEELPARFAKILAPSAKPEAPPVDALGTPVESAAAPAEEAPAEEAPAEEEAPAAERPAPGSREARVADLQARQNLQQEMIASSPLLARLIGTAGRGSSGLSGAADLGSRDIGDALAQHGTGTVAVVGSGNLRASSGTGSGYGPPGGAGSVEVAGVAGGSTNMNTTAPKVVRGAVSASGDAEVSGAEGQEGEIKSQVRRKWAGQLKFCYDTELKSDPELKGRVVASWTIEEGAVADVVIAENSTGNEALATCVRNKIKRWKFDGVEIAENIRFPFVFTPGE